MKVPPLKDRQSTYIVPLMDIRQRQSREFPLANPDLERGRQGDVSEWN